MSRYSSRTRSAHPAPLNLLTIAQQVERSTEPIPIEIVHAVAPLLDARGRRRSKANTPGAHRGVAPANKGLVYPPDPPTVAECMAMLRACGADPYGTRLYAAIILMWQGALRAFEALAITEADLDAQSGRIQIRHGKGDKQATIRMAQWAWPFLNDWRDLRRDLPNPRGPLLCVIDPPTSGRAWSYADLRIRLKQVAQRAGVTRRMSPHQLRHAFAAQASKGAVMASIETRPGEIVVDSQKAAAMADSNRRMWRALEGVRCLYDSAAEIHAAVEDVARALAAEPEYDAIPDYVQVDASWADTLPTCIECHADVPWAEAVLMPCSTVEDGDIDTLGIIHGNGCPASPPTHDTRKRG